MTVDPYTIPDRLDCGWMNTQLTPQLAQHWLQFAAPPYGKDFPWANLPLIEAYTKIIRRGGWQFREPPDPDRGFGKGKGHDYRKPIYFDSGFLMWGMTRCAAVVAAGKEITVRVEWGFVANADGSIIIDGRTRAPGGAPSIR